MRRKVLHRKKIRCVKQPPPIHLPAIAYITLYFALLTYLPATTSNTDARETNAATAQTVVREK